MDVKNGNARTYRTTDSSTTQESFAEASRMLDSALEQLDDIIAHSFPAEKLNGTLGSDISTKTFALKIFILMRKRAVS
jgi:hypothetical protein